MSQVGHASPASATTSILVARSDGLINTPERLVCSPGETVRFTASHPAEEVSCQLNGSGSLRFSNGEGQYQCPDSRGGRAEITCHIGAAPTACSPGFPIRFVYPDFAVSVLAEGPSKTYPDQAAPEADARHLGFNPEGCGLDLSDQGVAGQFGQILSLQGNAFGNFEDLEATSFMQHQVDRQGPVSCDLDDPVPAASGAGYASLRLGQAQDLSASHGGRYSEFAKDSPNWMQVEGNATTKVTFLDDNSFRMAVSAASRTNVNTPKRNQPQTHFRGAIQVARVFEVQAETDVTVSVRTAGSGRGGVAVTPYLLVGNTPVPVLNGFGGVGMPSMFVSQINLPNTLARQGSDGHIATATLPQPAHHGETYTYLILVDASVEEDMSGLNTKTREGVINWTADVRIEATSDAR